jgi:hypothetical protein
MGVWSDSEHLVALVDRQFKALRQLKGTQRIVRRRRLLEFLRREPLLGGVLQDFQAEAGNIMGSISSELTSIHAEVVKLWELHKARLRRKHGGVKDPKLSAFGSLDDKNPDSYYNCCIRQGVTSRQDVSESLGQSCHIVGRAVSGLLQFAEWGEQTATDLQLRKASSVLKRRGTCQRF